jgi:hypothetical protein
MAPPRGGRPGFQARMGGGRERPGLAGRERNEAVRASSRPATVAGWPRPAEFRVPYARARASVFFFTGPARVRARAGPNL